MAKQRKGEKNAVVDIAEMRRQVIAHDNAMEKYRGVSESMVRALALMPIECLDNGCLPPGSPSGQTLTALLRRGLAMTVEIRGRYRWLPTALGSALLHGGR